LNRKTGLAKMGIFLLGLFVGCMVVSTGLGGGILLTPLLIVAFHVSPIVAVGTALFCMSLTKVCAAIFHWKQNTIDFRLAASLAMGSIPGALGGSLIFNSFHNSRGESFESYLRIFIGIVLIVIAALSLMLDVVSGWFQSVSVNSPGLPAHEQRCAACIGFIGGLLVSTTSVGSGSLVVLLLLMFCRPRPAVLVGTDIFHGMILTTVATIAHLRLNVIDFHLVALLLLGSLPGVLLGGRLATTMAPVLLRRTLLVLVVAGGLVML
jgi:uncharacterized protein